METDDVFGYIAIEHIHKRVSRRSIQLPKRGQPNYTVDTAEEGPFTRVYVGCRERVLSGAHVERRLLHVEALVHVRPGS